MKKLIAIFFLAIAMLHVNAEPGYAESSSIGKNVEFRIDDVNLRSGPGVRHPVIRVLAGAKGKISKVIGVGGYRWLNIQYEEKTYWVHASLAQLIE